MKILSAAIMACLLLSVAGCDAKEDLNKPKTEVRTMIIGGMPASDQDYKMPKDQVILAEQIQHN
jgi:outer membrane murein-binding lipoprotein Lpp